MRPASATLARRLLVPRCGTGLLWCFYCSSLAYWPDGRDLMLRIENSASGLAISNRDHLYSCYISYHAAVLAPPWGPLSNVGANNTRCERASHSKIVGCLCYTCAITLTMAAEPAAGSNPAPALMSAPVSLPPPFTPFLLPSAMHKLKHGK